MLTFSLLQCQRRVSIYFIGNVYYALLYECDRVVRAKNSIRVAIRVQVDVTRPA